MVRLNIDFGERLHDFQVYIQRINDQDLRYDIKYHPSFASFKYRHLWVVSSPLDNNISVTLGLDLENTSDSHSKGFIEFNPNKVENSVCLHEFLEWIWTLTYRRDLIRYDLAIDIPYTRLMARLERNGRKGYQFVDSGNGITEYLGQRNKNGYIKLYDKTKESDLDYDLTRLEITLDKNADIRDVFPNVRISDLQKSLDTELDDNLDSTDKVLISLLRDVQNPQYYLNSLGFRKRKKIEPYLSDTTLSLNYKLAISVKTLAMSYEL